LICEKIQIDSTLPLPATLNPADLPDAGNKKPKIGTFIAPGKIFLRFQQTSFALSSRHVLQHKQFRADCVHKKGICPFLLIETKLQ